MLSPFECLCGNFILPEPASYVFFYAFSNLRNLLYIIGFWSEWRGSNSRPRGPKPMSQPSGRPVAPSLALSVAPAVPLWNSFGLFISDTAFVFWDLCGIEFCILKVLPTGFTSNSGCLSAESSSKIAPHKQRNKRDDTRQQADLDHSQPAERRWLFDVLPFSGNACSFA